MGHKASKEVPQEDVDYLLANTRFTEEQIREWYKGYRKDCPSGYLSRRKFLDVYSAFFPDGQARDFYAHVFRTFDKDNSGKIDFKEFLQAISITQNGAPEDKLDLAFRLYDIDNNGVIEEDEMGQIMQSIYHMVGKAPGLQSPEERTREIFGKMDKDNDGRLNKEEFVRGCMEDEQLYELLTCTNEAAAGHNGDKDGDKKKKGARKQKEQKELDSREKSPSYSSSSERRKQTSGSERSSDGTKPRDKKGHRESSARAGDKEQKRERSHHAVKADKEESRRSSKAVAAAADRKQSKISQASTKLRS